MLNIENTFIFSDFDGTITFQDVNDALFEKFGDEKNKIIEEKYNDGEIGHREALLCHYNNLNMSKRNFEEFILANIDIDPYFKQFYEIINNKGFNFAVISGGLIKYINLIFNREKIDFKHPIYANDIKFNNSAFEIRFYHSIKRCPINKKICGNCKHKILLNHKSRYNNIIYMGDGWTDRCATLIANKVLAKKNSSLEKYCHENDIKHEHFSSFNDIIKILLEN